MSKVTKITLPTGGTGYQAFDEISKKKIIVGRWDENHIGYRNSILTRTDGETENEGLIVFRFNNSWFSVSCNDSGISINKISEETATSYQPLTK